uniref:Anaphase-promoting complex subunit 2 n=1 Tax=Toxocara canis TaxID=6265 RepID=A0A183TWI9_TOXCA
LKLNDRDKHSDYDRYVYSSRYAKAIRDIELPADPSLEDVHAAAKHVDSLDSLDAEECVSVDGILLVHDFLTEQEEEDLVKKIDKKEWMISQSGRRKQDYGPRVNFKQKKVKMDRFEGMPEYTDVILEKMEAASAKKLGEFQPFELCNLEYVSDRLSAIEMHFDDSWIWGNRLIRQVFFTNTFRGFKTLHLNLLNNCVLTFTNDEKRLVVYVALPRRTLVCMADEVRYQWKHGVLSQHVRGRRIALTMREPSPAFQRTSVMLPKENVEGTEVRSDGSDEDEPMLTEADIKRITCINFIKRELQPKFKRFLSQMENQKRVELAQMMFKTLFAFESSIENETRSIYGEEVNEELLHEFFRAAGQILFSAEVISEFIDLLSRVLKFSYVLFGSIQNSDKRHVSFRRKALLLERISACIHMITEKDHYNVRPKVCMEAMRIACKAIVADLVRRACEEPFEQSLLDTLTQRVSGLTKWAIRLCLKYELQQLDNELKASMEKNVVDLITKQIFNLVIVDYPESGDLIDDLRYCMQNNGGYGRSKLTETLASEVERRLLHVGVGTRDILQGYASAVDCLRRLDPTCVIMQHICSIIRAYIKQRPDTVRSIITYITGEKREELSEQLAKKRAAIVDEEDMAGVNDELIGGDDESEQNWRDWQPDPPDAIPGQSRRFRQNADVFNMLVSVYGSKELFVKEYRQLLAERLTKSWNRDPLFELRYLELLKLRFSEGELQQCEVMLKDMRDSDRIDRHVCNSLYSFQPFPISARIISAFFWPKIENEKFNLPDEMMYGLSVYGKGFETHKASRKLDWMTGVGCVEMDIELDGIIVSLAVAPAYAAVLTLFTKKGNAFGFDLLWRRIKETWTLNEMASVLEMDKRNVKKRLEWWQNSGIVAIATKSSDSESETWCLASANSKMDRLRGEYDVEDESSDEERGEDTAAVDALEQYWTYTRSYMANQEPLKPERLHTIFRMFASPGQQGPSLETVIAFLQRKVKQNLLTCSNGLYKVVKEASAH